MASAPCGSSALSLLLPRRCVGLRCRGRGRAGCGRSSPAATGGGRRGSPWTPALRARLRPGRGRRRGRERQRGGAPVAGWCRQRRPAGGRCVKCRPSAAFPAWGGAWSGINRAIASAVGRRGRRCRSGVRTPPPGRRRTPPPPRTAANVASAIRRARQASRSPACTYPQHSRAGGTSAPPPPRSTPGRRRWSGRSRAQLRDAEPETNGAPSPARVRPVSPQGVIQVAASAMNSVGAVRPRSPRP